MKRTRSLSRFLSRLALLLAALFLVPLSACGDYVFLSDGFTLRGKLQKEGEILRDPSGQELWIPKFGGFYVIDDRVRRVIFSQRNVTQAIPDPEGQVKAQETFYLKPVLHQLSNSPTLRSFRQKEATDWQPNGERVLTLTTEVAQGTASRKVEQALQLIGPSYAIAGGRKYRWNCSLRTNELGPETCLAIIRHHLRKRNDEETKAKGSQADALKPEQRLSLARFCIQAGWWDDAERELAALDADFPDEAKKREPLWRDLRRGKANSLTDAIERAYRAGQHQRAQGLISAFRDDGASEWAVGRVASVRAEYRARSTVLSEARKHLAWVNDACQDAAAKKSLAEALAEIQRDLNLDTAGRLHSFVTLAAQEERNRRDKRPADLAPEQLLALAVSGWALGSNGAEADIAQARRLWQARQFLLRYLRLFDAAERTQFLDRYSQSEALRVDIMTQLIELLPPAQPEAATGPGIRELTTAAAKGSKGAAYLVQPPPEYHPHRAYPVLIVLHNSGEEPARALEPWSVKAAEHGYLLVAPRWADLFGQYRASEKEHQAVIDVLRDLRRRYHVDSERVMLAGFDEAATMACDLGMARPDEFAGVVAICGLPGKLANSYWTNAQLLPFYVVDGDRNEEGRLDAKVPRDYRMLMEKWLPRGYPSLYVEYNGRGVEFFSGELPTIFDWLARRRRGRGLPDLGRPDPQGGGMGQEFRSSRAGDNRFYWVGVEGIANPSIMARVTARIAEPNKIVVNTANFRSVSVWLNGGMVDFDQPVEIRLNPSSSAGKIFKRQVEPNLRVLLEDYWDRGDKKNLFVARIDFK